MKSFFKDYVTKTFLIPFDQGDLSSTFNEKFDVQETNYTENGTELTVNLPQASAERYSKYEIKK